MTPTETAAILRQFNEWRRGDEGIPQFDPRAKIEAMEKQFPICRVKDIKRAHYMTKVVGLDPDAWLYVAPGARHAQNVPECPYPCGWRNLLNLAIEDGAHLARSINEGEPVTENARAVTMRMVMRLRDVLMAINNAAPEAKP